MEWFYKVADTKRRITRVGGRSSCSSNTAPDIKTVPQGILLKEPANAVKIHAANLVAFRKNIDALSANVAKTVSLAKEIQTGISKLTQDFNTRNKQ